MPSPKSSTATENPFEALSEIGQVLVPIAFQLSQAGEEGSSSVPTSPVLRFDIRSVSAAEFREAEAIVDEAKAPALTTEERASTGVGSRTIQTGYDFEDPGYLAERSTKVLLRNGLLALYGCPKLMETTPGASPRAKAEELVRKIPHVALIFLVQEIENLGIRGGGRRGRGGSFFYRKLRRYPKAQKFYLKAESKLEEAILRRKDPLDFEETFHEAARFWNRTPDELEAKPPHEQVRMITHYRLHRVLESHGQHIEKLAHDEIKEKEKGKRP